MFGRVFENARDKIRSRILNHLFGSEFDGVSLVVGQNEYKNGYNSTNKFHSRKANQADKETRLLRVMSRVGISRRICERPCRGFKKQIINIAR